METKQSKYCLQYNSGFVESNTAPIVKQQLIEYEESSTQLPLKGSR